MHNIFDRNCIWNLYESFLLFFEKGEAAIHIPVIISKQDLA